MIPHPVKHKAIINILNKIINFKMLLLLVILFITTNKSSVNYSDCLCVMFIANCAAIVVVIIVTSCAKDILDTNGTSNCVINCFKLNSKHSDVYSSFHVAVNVDAADMKLTIDKLTAADSWPSGILVRRYFTPKNG